MFGINLFHTLCNVNLHYCYMYYSDQNNIESEAVAFLTCPTSENKENLLTFLTSSVASSEQSFMSTMAFTYYSASWKIFNTSSLPLSSIVAL